MKITIILLFFFLTQVCSGLTWSSDTIVEVEYQGEYCKNKPESSSICCKNKPELHPVCLGLIEVTNESDTDTITIDSIKFNIITERPIKHSEAAFLYQKQQLGCLFTYENKNGTPFYYSSYNEQSTFKRKIIIPPKSKIDLSDFELKHCVVCPLQKKSSGTSDINPCHLEANFIFVYENNYDTLTFIGCQKWESSIINRNSNSHRVLNSYELFNLNGRVQQYSNLKNGILIRKLKKEGKR